VYTFEARDIVFRDNTFRDNSLYGLDPHDYSTHLTVENNLAYGNGSHGLIFSRGVVDSVMRNNHVYDYQGNGIVLDLASDRNTIENNVVENNKKDGIVLIGSGSSIIRNNTISGNRTGIRLNKAGARDVQIEGNLLEGNRVGVQAYTGAGDIRLVNNIIRNTSGAAVKLDAAPVSIDGLEVTDATIGVDTRSPVTIHGATVTNVEYGVVTRDLGIVSVVDSTLHASQVGIRLLPGSNGNIGTDVSMRAPEAIKATTKALDWRRFLPYVGLGALGVAAVLELLRGARTRGETFRLAPAGVANIQ
jgi:parallel beta-helix repeat protein